MMLCKTHFSKKKKKKKEHLRTILSSCGSYIMLLYVQDVIRPLSNPLAPAGRHIIIVKVSIPTQSKFNVLMSSVGLTVLFTSHCLSSWFLLSGIGCITPLRKTLLPWSIVYFHLPIGTVYSGDVRVLLSPKKDIAKALMTIWLGCSTLAPCIVFIARSTLCVSVCPLCMPHPHKAISVRDILSC